MSVDSVGGPTPLEERLVEFMKNYEPVINFRKPDVALQSCTGGCGNQVSPPVTMCVRCRNTSAHPALWGRRQTS